MLFDSGHACRVLNKENPYVSFHFNIDGTDYPDDLGQTMAFDEFYRIADGAMPKQRHRLMLVNIMEFLNLS